MKNLTVTKTYSAHLYILEQLSAALSSIAKLPPVEFATNYLNLDINSCFRYLISINAQEKLRIKAAAMIQSMLRIKQTRFAAIKAIGAMNDEKRRETLVEIMELTEEYRDIRNKLIYTEQIDLHIDGVTTLHFLFYSFNDYRLVSTLEDFSHLYNKWVGASIDYYILAERLHYELDQLHTAFAKNNDIPQTDQAQLLNQLQKEYDEMLRNSEKNILQYYLDLKSISVTLEEQYGILEKIDGLRETSICFQ